MACLIRYVQLDLLPLSLRHSYHPLFREEGAHCGLRLCNLINSRSLHHSLQASTLESALVSLVIFRPQLISNLEQDSILLCLEFDS